MIQPAIASHFLGTVQVQHFVPEDILKMFNGMIFEIYSNDSSKPSDIRLRDLGQRSFTNFHHFFVASMIKAELIKYPRQSKRFSNFKLSNLKVSGYVDSKIVGIA